MPQRRRRVNSKVNSNCLKVSIKREKNAHPPMLLLGSQGFTQNSLFKRPERIIPFGLYTIGYSGFQPQKTVSSHAPPQPGASTNQQRPVWSYHSGEVDKTGIWYLESRDGECPAMYRIVPYGDELSCPKCR